MSFSTVGPRTQKISSGTVTEGNVLNAADGGNDRFYVLGIVDFAKFAEVSLMMTTTVYTAGGPVTFIAAPVVNNTPYNGLIDMTVKPAAGALPAISQAIFTINTGTLSYSPMANTINPTNAAGIGITPAFSFNSSQAILPAVGAYFLFFRIQLTVPTQTFSFTYDLWGASSSSR